MAAVKHVSLDELHIEVKSQDGKKKHQRPALNEHWVERREWMQFIPLTRTKDEARNIDQWTTAANELKEDLHWLLSLPHYRFWSQLVFDPGVKGALTSYLELAPRSYDPDLTQLSEESRSILSNLHSLIFKVYTRITTIKESEECFMSRECHAKLLYEHFIMDVPTMMDLCLLYGHGNTKKTLARGLSHVFDVQPKYYSDVEFAIESKALKELSTYFVSQPSEGTEDEAREGIIPLRNRAPGRRGDIGQLQLQDRIMFLLDIVTSLSILLELLPRVCNTLSEKTVEINVANFYEAAIPEFYKNIANAPETPESIELKKNIDIARFHLLSIVKSLVTSRIAVICDADDLDWANSKSEVYVAVLSECLEDVHFIRDYDTFSPIVQDLDAVRQKCPNQLDPTKYYFIVNSIKNCYPTQTEKQEEGLKIRIRQKCVKLPPPPSDHIDLNGFAKDEDDAQALVLESLVSEIQSILPDLGSGFLQACLRHYNFDKEHVINAILEESLPKELQSLERSMPLPVFYTDETVSLNAVYNRLNVFDHDEFDVMSRDHIDTSRVHQGKRKAKHKNLTQLMNDNEEVKQMKDVYLRYGSVQDVVYDDEYDDTYDDVNDVGVDQPDPYTDRRPFVMPRVLSSQQRTAEDDSEEDNEPEESEESKFVPKDKEAFVQDPAEMRAKAEQRRASKMGQNYRPPPPSKDVVGKPKGQGQDTNVLINRQRKNTNKSSQANHNRKSGAQRKMRQGMLPS